MAVLLLENNFNSHAHVERDKETVDVIKIIGISTHTLTWSVTRSSGRTYLAFMYFNSHAHVERDVGDFSTFKWGYSISTHTLTWSVTS